MTTDIERHVPTTATAPITGEVYDLTDTDQAAALSSWCSSVWGQLRTAKDLADAALRGRMLAGLVTSLQTENHEVTTGAGRAEYGADAMHDELMTLAEDPANGIDPAAVEALFVVERRVVDGRELNKLAGRHTLIGQVVAKHTKRGPGAIKVKRRPAAQAPAPVTPQYIRDEAAQITRESDDAAARGI